MNKVSGKLSEMQLGRISRGSAASRGRQVVTALETGEPTPKIFQNEEGVRTIPFVTSAGIHDNMCAFQAMFNSFNDKQRVAFAAGDLKDYTKAFVENTREFIQPVLKSWAAKKPELMKQEDVLNKAAKLRMMARVKKASGGKKVDVKMGTSKTGYTPVHIRAYLVWLQKKKIIKSFKFNRLKKGRDNLFKILDPERQFGMKVLVSGVSVPSDKRPAKNIRTNMSMSCGDLRNACNSYDHWCNTVSLGHGKCTHGLVLAQDGFGEVYMYDDACKVIHNVTRRPERIGDQIANIFAMHVFDIEV